MADLYPQGIRRAKKTLDDWFSGPHGQRMFLAETGPGVPVTREQERAVRVGVEPVLARAHRSSEVLAAMTLAIAVLPLAAGLLGPVQLPIWLLIGPLMAGAAILSWIGFRNNRSVRDLRAATTMALGDHAGIERAIEPRAKVDPKSLKTILVVSIAAAGLWPLLFVPLKGVLPPGGSWLIDIVPGMLVGVAIAAAVLLWLVERARRRG